MSAEDNTGQSSASVTNAVLKSEMDQHKEQLNKLWTINTEQVRQLAKLEDVPQKLDQLLTLNTALATLTQSSIAHGAAIDELKKRADESDKAHGALDKKVANRMGYFAGAIAVASVVVGILCWLGQQAITGAFIKINDTDTSINALRSDVNLLKFQAQTFRKN
jgi:hypothetical protein